MKKLIIISAVLSLIIFSGCTLFSGKESAPEDTKTSVLPQAEAQNEPAETQKEVVTKATEGTTDSKPVVVQPAETAKPESAEVKLAKCLTQKGVELYTSSSCPHCKNQKEAFKDGMQYLPDNECLAFGGWSQACKDKEIEAVPTWIFPDGERLTGQRPLETLAERSGCEYNPAS